MHFMITKLFQAVFCPFQENPTKDNTCTEIIIANDFFDAVRMIRETCLIEGRELVSVSYFGNASTVGSIVDFE